MRHILLSMLGCLVLLAGSSADAAPPNVVFFLTSVTTIPIHAAERPNIIVIMADDKYAPDASQPLKCPDSWCFYALFRRMSF